MNTIPVIHLDQWVRREERASPVNFKQPDSAPETTKVRHRGHGRLSASRLSERAAALGGGGGGEGGRKLAGALTDAASGTLMSHWCPCCLPIELGARRPESQGNNPACASLFNFSPISITLRRSMKSSSATASRACGR